MNNKQLGNEFEKEIVKLLAGMGYWVHFMTPSANGSQPFDIIAVKNDHVICGDCKTCKKPIFSAKRLEYNQIYAFEKWIKKGNSDPIIFVKHEGKIYFISYERLMKEGEIDLREEGSYASIG